MTVSIDTLSIAGAVLCALVLAWQVAMRRPERVAA
jgi:hypothetical protein